MVVVVSLLDLLNVFGAYVFGFNVSVELLQTARDSCGIVTSGRVLVLGKVLLTLSKGGKQLSSFCCCYLHQ